MKMTTYLIIGAILIVTSGIFIACKPKDQSTDKQVNTQTDKKSELPENPFNGLRQMALSMTPEQLGLETSDKTKVFGTVMDWDLGDGIATVVAYETHATTHSRDRCKQYDQKNSR